MDRTGRSLMDKDIRQGEGDDPLEPEVEAGRPAEPDPGALLDALPDPLLQVARDGAILFANLAAEPLFAASAASLCRGKLSDVLPADSPLFALIGQVLAGGNEVSEYGLTLETPRIGSHLVDL
ncbi:MAG: PAS domain-containing protein, partial [Alphaproteobacteria bacterium]